jgi:hypothetical protein
MIPDYVKIEKLKTLDEAIAFLKKAVADGVLIQYWKTDAIGYTKEKIEDIGVDGTYPDIIEIFFKSKDSSKNYKLSVNVYHGAGGEWTLVE